MNRLRIGLLTAIITVLVPLATVAAPAPDFGAPPGGEIPIIFNDRHVYASPDRRERRRVLAALVRGTTILVPLRSMFEQMGATVRFDPRTKTVDVFKPGSDVQVMVGRAVIVINGETRPLDVPPEIDGGVVLVPLRVISEGMGAYVRWLPARRTVVVRYVAAPPPPAPSPAPAAPATAAPTPAPNATPAPKSARRYDRFIVGDYLFSPKVYNEFSPGNTGAGVSYAAHGAAEFSFFRLPLMIGGDYTRIRYPHNDNGTGRRGDPGFVTVVGGYGQTEVPAFAAKETTAAGRIGVKVADPRVYVGIGYLRRETNYGYPKQNGLGLGVEKLPDLGRTFAPYGSAYYYPDVSGDYTYPQDLYTCPPGGAAACAPGSLYGTSAKLSDRFLTYRVGVSVLLTGVSDPFGLFLDGGYLGDSIHTKSLAPADASHTGAYLGLGLKF